MGHTHRRTLTHTEHLDGSHFSILFHTDLAYYHTIIHILLWLYICKFMVHTTACTRKILTRTLLRNSTTLDAMDVPSRCMLYVPHHRPLTSHLSHLTPHSFLLSYLGCGCGCCVLCLCVRVWFVCVCVVCVSVCTLCALHFQCVCFFACFSLNPELQSSLWGLTVRRNSGGRRAPLVAACIH